MLLRVGMGQHLHGSPQEGLPSSLEQVKFAAAMLEVEEMLGVDMRRGVSGQLWLLGSNSALSGVLRQNLVSADQRRAMNRKRASRLGLSSAGDLGYGSELG
ncbi:predicted protein [Verticillium alfalfae VaMs.102]|uniref:Predicted protein n=1 Tax=Verticillium alfalfae (strain VaMs.102 / ATCC MYA-4576 / FGSC 10136) TaxID=526221 RepID=C9SDA3_VERA1|nr:predicted protein [Verticillium alfalfae VaMs.102]EEY16405.1 predicted protein [Verticillium alfalfae VaMs.102]